MCVGVRGRDASNDRNGVCARSPSPKRPRHGTEEPQDHEELDSEAARAGYAQEYHSSNPWWPVDALEAAWSQPVARELPKGGELRFTVRLGETSKFSVSVARSGDPANCLIISRLCWLKAQGAEGSMRVGLKDLVAYRERLYKSFASLREFDASAEPGASELHRIISIRNH